MKILGLSRLCIFALILIVAFFVSGTVIVKAMTVYAVHFVDTPQHQNNAMTYVALQDIKPWIHFIDNSNKHPLFQPSSSTIRFIYAEKYGSNYPELFDNEHDEEKTDDAANKYETDLDDHHDNCNWDSRYSAKYNRINNCYFS